MLVVRDKFGLVLYVLPATYSRTPSTAAVPTTSLNRHRGDNHNVGTSPTTAAGPPSFDKHPSCRTRAGSSSSRSPALRQQQAAAARTTASSHVSQPQTAAAAAGCSRCQGVCWPATGCPPQRQEWWWWWWLRTPTTSISNSSSSSMWCRWQCCCCGCWHSIVCQAGAAAVQRRGHDAAEQQAVGRAA